MSDLTQLIAKGADFPLVYLIVLIALAAIALAAFAIHAVHSIAKRKND